MRQRAPRPLQLAAHTFVPADPERHPTIQTCALCPLPRRNRHHLLDDPTLFSAGSTLHVPN